MRSFQSLIAIGIAQTLFLATFALPEPQDNDIVASIVLARSSVTLTLINNATMSSILSSVSTPSVLTTTLGVPIATVCPVNPITSSMDEKLAEIVDVDVTQAFDPISTPTTSFDTTTDILVSASAMMPDGSMTTFASLARREVEVSGVPEVTISSDGISGAQSVPDLQFEDGLAKIVIGADGCQTLFTPTVTAVCSTVVSPFGIAPVTITDCDQYITFSSETLFSCAPTPTIQPLPAGSADGSVPVRNRLDVTAHEDLNTAADVSILPTVSVTQEADPLITNLDVPLDADADADTDTDSADTPMTSDMSLSRRDLTTWTTGPEDVPMSFPRHLLAENQLKKRQVLILKGKPYTTDLVTVTPDASIEMEMDRVATATELPIVREGRAMDAVHVRRARDVVRESLRRRQVEVDGLNVTVVVAAKLETEPLTDIDVSSSSLSASSVPLPPLPNAVDASVLAILSTTSEPMSPIIPQTIPIADIVADLPADTIVDSYTPPTPSLPLDSMTIAPLETIPTISDPSTLSLTATPILSSIPDPPLNPALDVLASSIPILTISEPTDPIFIPNSDSTTLPSLPIRAPLFSPPNPTKYYAAPWRAFLAPSSLPTTIKGITCRGGLEPVGSCLSPDTDGDTESCECEVEDEVWSVSSVTLTRVGTSTVVFDGVVGVVGGGGMGMMSTRVTVSTILTTTVTDVVGKIIKRTLKREEGTVYATRTTYPSVTMTLVPGDGMVTSSSGAVESSSTLDAAMEVNARMPQSAPTSFLPDTDTVTPSWIPFDALTTAVTGFPLSSISMPLIPTVDAAPTNLRLASDEVPSALDTDSNINTNVYAKTAADVEGTVLVTSVVATETVTVPPAEATETSSVDGGGGDGPLFVDGGMVRGTGKGDGEVNVAGLG